MSIFEFEHIVNTMNSQNPTPMEDETWQDILDSDIEDEILQNAVDNYKDPQASHHRRKPRRKRGKKELLVPHLHNRTKTTKRIELVLEFMTKAKFASLSQFLCALFSDQKSTLVNCCGRFMLQGGFSKIITMWFEDKRSSKLSVDHRKDLLKLVHNWFESEIHELERRKVLYHKAEDFTPEDIAGFDFTELGQLYQRYCPLLYGFLQRLGAAKECITKKPSEKHKEQEQNRGIENSTDTEDGNSEDNGLEYKVKRVVKNRDMITVTVFSSLMYS